MLRKIGNIQRTYTYAFLSLGFWFLTASGLLGQNNDLPNILLIVSEDNGPHFNCYGDSTIPTPSLDLLAANGVKFTQAYATQAGCSPSRSSILTGLYPHQNGQIGLATHRYTMFKSWQNLPSYLKSAGYSTGIIGKIHVNPEDAFPFDFTWHGNKENDFGNRDVNRVAEVADSFLMSTSGPHFLMVNYADAHVPHLDQSFGLPHDLVQPQNVKPFPAIGFDTPNVRTHMASYYNCIQRLDAGVGALMKKVGARSNSKNTLVIYISDHGPQFSRGKMTAYEMGSKIPMIVSWQGRIEGGKTVDKLVSTIDLLPSILDVCGLEASQKLPGKSLWPLISNPDSKNWRKFLATEYTVHFPHSYYPQRTIRDDRYKLICNLLSGENNPLFERYLNYGNDVTAKDLTNGSVAQKEVYDRFKNLPRYELYDLKNDPAEWVNLAGDPTHSKRLKKLQKALDQWQEETDDAIRLPENLERLNKEHFDLIRYTEDTWVVRTNNYEWNDPQYLQE